MTNTNLARRTWTTREVSALCGITYNVHQRVGAIAQRAGLRPVGIGHQRTLTRDEVITVWLDVILTSQTHRGSTPHEVPRSQIAAVIDALEHDDPADWLITGGGIVHCCTDADLPRVLVLAANGYTVRTVRLAPLHEFLERP